jgi:hypothetical protein
LKPSDNADNNSISIKVAKYGSLTKAELIENNEYGYCSLVKATKQVLDKIEIKDAEIPVIANVNALAETKAADIRTHLVEQAAHAVRWAKCPPPRWKTASDTLLRATMNCLCASTSII